MDESMNMDTTTDDGVMGADDMAQALGFGVEEEGQTETIVESEDGLEEGAEAAQDAEEAAQEGEEAEDVDPALAEERARIEQLEAKLASKEEQERVANLKAARASGDLFAGRPDPVLAAFGDSTKPLETQEGTACHAIATHAGHWVEGVRGDFRVIRDEIEAAMKNAGEEGVDGAAILALLDQYAEQVVTNQTKGLLAILTSTTLDAMERTVSEAETSNKRNETTENIQTRWNEAWDEVRKSLGEGESIPEADMVKATEKLNRALVAGFSVEEAMSFALGPLASGIDLGKKAAANQRAKADTDRAHRQSHRGGGRTPSRTAVKPDAQKQTYEEWLEAVMSGT